MPQMTKGGKYIFGWSKIGKDGKLTFPTIAVEEYKLQEETYIYIVSGSKQTGWFLCNDRIVAFKFKTQKYLERKPLFSR